MTRGLTYVRSNITRQRKTGRSIISYHIIEFGLLYIPVVVCIDGHCDNQYTWRALPVYPARRYVASCVVSYVGRFPEYWAYYIITRLT